MSDRKLIILAICLIVILNFIAFSPILTANFLNWDDEENVVYAERIRMVGSDGLLWIFTDFTVGDFKPLAWLSYCFDYAFWELNPSGYHLGNLLLHAASGVLALLLFFRLGSRFFPARHSGLIFPAFLSALFFTLHPLRVESVAWISERKDVLCCFFYLVSIIAYLRYTARRQPGWYAFALISALLAMLSKPMAVTIPIVMILIDLLSAPEGERRFRLVEKLPFFLLSIIIGSLAIYGQSRHQALVSLRIIGPGERIFLFCRALSFYLEKIFFPVRISAAYPASAIFPQIPGGGTAPVILIISLTLAAFLFIRRGGRGLLFFWLWFVVTILPVSGILPSGMVSAADRFTYIPSFGIAGLLFLGLVFLDGDGGSRKIIFPSLAGIFCLLLLTSRQAGVWKDSETLWGDAVKKYPDTPMARAHLGQLLYQRGEDESAIFHLRGALELIEKDPMARGDIIFAVKSNLARALGRIGQPAAGAEILEEILESRDDWVTHHSLAGMYSRMGRKEEAVVEYEEVLRTRPAFVPALCEYGLLLAQSGRIERAIAVYNHALAVLPDSPRARYNLSLALLDRGKPERAIPLLKKLAAEYPDRALVARALLIAYRVAGRGEAADLIRKFTGKEENGFDNQLPYSKGERPDVLVPIR